jgi:hypothetical protein
MGETREDLGTMADPGELVAALTVIGFLQRGFTGAEQAREIKRAGGVELHRLEMAHTLAGAAEMQVLMAAGAAADAGADPAKVSHRNGGGGGTCPVLKASSRAAAAVGSGPARTPACPPRR